MAVLLVPVFGIVLLFFLVHLGRVKVYERVITPADGVTPPGALANRAFLPTLTDFAYKRRVFEVLHDLLIIVLAYYAAFLMRFDGELVEPFYSRLLESLPVVIVVQISAFLGAGPVPGAVALHLHERPRHAGSGGRGAPGWPPWWRCTWCFAWTASRGACW